MRTRTRKPVSHATLLNHFGWASARNHGREMRKAREENEMLKLSLRVQQALRILLFIPLLALAQPPPPPMSALLRTLGKEGSHYTAPVSVVVTQTVTTVYELDYMRYIRTALNASNSLTFKTNFLLLETNVLFCVTNTTASP